MCIAIGAVLGAALSIAQMGMSMQAQNEQKAAANAQYEKNRTAAISAAGHRYAQIGATSEGEREKALQKIFNDRVEYIKKRSTQIVSNGEGGITGISSANLISDFAAQQARIESATQTNWHYKLASLKDEAIATYHDMVGRINSVTPGTPVPGFTPFQGGFSAPFYNQGSA